MFLALEIIQEDYRQEHETMNCEYDMSPENLNIIAGNKAESQLSFGNKITNLLKFSPKK